MYIMLFEPELKERVWGGDKLKTFFGKDLPFDHTGESWEIACHENGNSIVKNGFLQGERLKDLLGRYPMEILGYTQKENEKFPLLLKFIDAKDLLSVQVHPDDAYAQIYEQGELGKNEAWVIIDAKEDATLILGLKDGVTREKFIEAFEEERLEEVLNEVPVKKGDVLNIPAGLIHAIGEGILLAEVQQNSDTTYRVYDWGRVGLDGKKREIHFEKSLDVIDFKGIYDREPVVGRAFQGDGYEEIQYIENAYFTLDKVIVRKDYRIKKEKNHFELFMCLDGDAKVTCEENTIHIKKGDSFMVPGCVSCYTIEGKVELIRTRR